jgi:uncharacterized Zn-binding protein involved in type VI secretion
MPPLSSEIAQKLASYESRKVPAVKASYPVATTGARTRDGGVLRAGSSKLAVDDLAAGRVGDEVVYSGGSVAYITSGSGSAFVEGGRCLGIVGGDLSNGDVITESPNDSFTLSEHEGEPPIPGLLDPAYAPLIVAEHGMERQCLNCAPQTQTIPTHGTAPTPDLTN